MPKILLIDKNDKEIGCEYWIESEKISTELNNYFDEFLKVNPEFNDLKDVYKKPAHLNGVQFYGGFIAGSNKKEWKKFIIIPVIIELIMIWAYKTNQIVDDKKTVWKDKESIKDAVLKHDLLLALIFRLVSSTKKLLKTKFDYFDSLVKEMLSSMSQGFFIEKSQLNINFSSQEKILKNWKNKYAERNIKFNLVYDYAPLIGFWLATDDVSIFKKYNKYFETKNRFSEVGQIINDIGDWMNIFDNNVRDYQDQFADIRNGIITWPVYHSLTNEDIIRALKTPEITLRKDWQKKILKLKPALSAEIKKISKKCFADLADFWHKNKKTDDDFVIKTCLLLKHNKYLK